MSDVKSDDLFCPLACELRVVRASKPMSTMVLPLVSKFSFPLIIGFRQETFRSGGVVILLEHVFGGVVTDRETKQAEFVGRDRV